MGQEDGQFAGNASGEPAAATVASGVFDGYDITDVPLGDLMRGERATLGKSLLDVERELKIRATYIAAIENGDVGAFSSPGFIAGYVRSYARYLGIEPEWAFRRFCAETGFGGVHEGSAQSAAAKRGAWQAPRLVDPNEVIRSARISFAPERKSPFAGIEPGALGSAAVLLALVLGIGYGGWAVLHDIQRLQIAPVEEAPIPLAQLDPLAGATSGRFDLAGGDAVATLPGAEDARRLYRPTALETPILTPRDGALATLDPDEVGTLSGLGAMAAAQGDRLQPASLATETAATDPAAATPVQVTEAQDDSLLIFAVRPSWIRVSSASGATLFEGTLNRGDSYRVDLAGETAPRLRSGNAGSLYFVVNGVTFGPAGPGATVVRDVELSADAVTSSYALADAGRDPDLPAVAALVMGPDAAN